MRRSLGIGFVVLTLGCGHSSGDRGDAGGTDRDAAVSDGGGGSSDGGARDAGSGSDSGSGSGSDSGSGSGSDSGSGSGSGSGSANAPVGSWSPLPAQCDGTFIPGTFRGIWFADTLHGFAVGTAGIYQTSTGGTSWHCTNATATMSAISGRSATNAYAAGYAPGGFAELLRWDGSTWTPTVYTTGPSLDGIWSSDGVTPWVVGEGFVESAGATLRYFAGDGNLTSTAIWGADATHVWEVGGATENEGSFTGGYAYDWNGSTWSFDPVTSAVHDLTGVSGVDSANVWVVGLGGSIAKLTSTSWADQAANTAADLYAVDARSYTDAYAVGATGTIDHFDGSAWHLQTSPTTSPLYGVAGVDPSHEWAAGDDGTILAGGSAAWTAQTRGNAADIVGIAMPDRDHAWAVTDREDRILVYAGGQWSRAPLALGASGLGVFALDAAHVWVTSAAATIWKWDGAQWTSTPAPTTLPIAGVWAADATHAWALDWDGQAMTSSGGAWTGAPTGLSSGGAITGADADHVWAIGGSGGIAMWNGAVWVGQTSGTTQWLDAAWAADATHVWAVGEAGTILFYDGTSWHAQASGLTGTLRSIWGSDPSHVWVVQTDGTIAMFDGATWTVQQPAGRAMYAVGGADAAHVLVGGADGFFLQGVPAP